MTGDDRRTGLLDGLVSHLAAALADYPPGDTERDAGPCLAVWRSPTDRALVACAEDAVPGRDRCGYHADRRNGRVDVWRERSEAVRVERPPAVVS